MDFSAPAPDAGASASGTSFDFQPPPGFEAIDSVLDELEKLVKQPFNVEPSTSSIIPAAGNAFSLDGWAEHLEGLNIDPSMTLEHGAASSWFDDAPIDPSEVDFFALDAFIKDEPYTPYAASSAFGAAAAAAYAFPLAPPATSMDFEQFHSFGANINWNPEELQAALSLVTQPSTAIAPSALGSSISVAATVPVGAAAAPCSIESNPILGAANGSFDFDASLSVDMDVDQGIESGGDEAGPSSPESPSQLTSSPRSSSPSPSPPSPSPSPQHHHHHHQQQQRRQLQSLSHTQLLRSITAPPPHTSPSKSKCTSPIRSKIMHSPPHRYHTRSSSKKNRDALTPPQDTKVPLAAVAAAQVVFGKDVTS